MNTGFRWLSFNHDNVLQPLQRATHTYVIGQPGTGKSRALESWILQDVLAGHGVGVIDPHGDLFNNLVFRLAKMPKLWKRVVIVNPLDEEWTMCFNPLEVIRDFPIERIAQFLTDVALKIWKIDPTEAPRMVWLLSNTFLALSSLRLSLLDLQQFLLDGKFRQGQLRRLGNPRVEQYFTQEFPNRPGSVHQWITPVLNKLGGLVFDPDVRLMLAQGSTINFRELIDKQRILLVNIPKGLLGEGTSGLLGAFIIAHLQKAALSRADVQYRKPFYLYLDEFQHYTTDNVKDILSESRKYALSLTLAHQYLDQLDPDIRNAILNTAGTMLAFRIGHKDAVKLAKEIFPSPDYLSRNKSQLAIDLQGTYPRIKLKSKKSSSSWESLALQLTNLRHREFWFKRRGSRRATKQRTFEMSDIDPDSELERSVRDLIETSGQFFGRRKEELRKELGIYQHQSTPSERNGHSETRTTSDGTTTPFWGD